MAYKLSYVHRNGKRGEKVFLTRYGMKTYAEKLDKQGAVFFVTKVKANHESVLKKKKAVKMKNDFPSFKNLMKQKSGFKM